jgi:hypothetical protein
VPNFITAELVVAWKNERKFKKVNAWKTYNLSENN